MFVADLKLIHNFCGKFYALSLGLWHILCVNWLPFPKIDR